MSAFAYWADKVRELVPELCGYTTEKVPVWYLEELFREGLSINEAAGLIASAITP